MKKVKKPVLWIVLGFLFMLGILGYVARGFWHPYRVPSGSMSPSIPEGSYVLVNDWDYQAADDIERGDVIAFDTPPMPKSYQLAEGSIFVFRVVGLPGDTISFDEQGRFIVNGEAIKQMERGGKMIEQQGEKFYEVLLGKCRAGDEVTIGKDCFFVAGDNRPSALDSRYWGVVPFDRILGKARVG